MTAADDDYLGWFRVFGDGVQEVLGYLICEEPDVVLVVGAEEVANWKVVSCFAIQLL